MANQHHRRPLRDEINTHAIREAYIDAHDAITAAFIGAASVDYTSLSCEPTITV